MAFALAFLVIELAIVISAWRLGGPSERAGAGILLAMVAIAYVGILFQAPVFHRVDPIGLAVDLIGLAGFCWLAFSSRKFWPVWAASLQLLSMSAHLVRALDVPVRAPVYYWMKGLPTLGVLMLLGWATWRHRRMQRRAKRGSWPR
jgi:hypothetical protein